MLEVPQRTIAVFGPARRQTIVTPSRAFVVVRDLIDSSFVLSVLGRSFKIRKIGKEDSIVTFRERAFRGGARPRLCARGGRCS